ncbi:hypothetical protein ACIGZI_33450 [Streptomyces griseus]|uniref:hypothetical protein n=1 Tax=Streptomyces griseus TaxID=1911 RepID=UPI0037D34566
MSKPLRVHPIRGARARRERDLLQLVEDHYDNEPLMRLAGEIHFDMPLSRADVEAVLRIYGRPAPQTVYLPCAGTLRHVAPLLEQGCHELIAVDLSWGSLSAGLSRNVPSSAADRLTVCHGDVRDAGEVLPREGAELVFLGGNSLGDLTNPDGHAELLAALARALAPEGVLVFDYVGDRYLPGPGTLSTEWPETLRTADGDIEVLDRRTRSVSPLSGSPMSVLNFTCEILEVTSGAPVVPMHSYRKLIVPERLLTQQFRQAGLKLCNVGPVAEWSTYHRDRIAQTGDLGMLGEPNCWYRAVKDPQRSGSRSQ